jgi:hypothetical protein
LWEFVSDPGVRTGLRASHGFCRNHAELALAVAGRETGRVGMAILAEDLLRHVRADADLATLARGRARRRDLARRRGRDLAMLDPTAACPVCRESSRTEDAYLRHLAAARPGDPVDELAGDGGVHLCFPHLRRGLAVVPEAADALLRTYRSSEERLRRDLAELIRKQDYRFQHEGLTPGQADAWIRGFRALAGEPVRLVDDRRTDP